MLEHIDVTLVSAFLAEIRRVLKPGGIQRIVVPDMEARCRNYLAHLTACISSPELARDHDQYVGAIIEQIVRREAAGTSQQPAARRFAENLLLGDARRRGETHRWMYDQVNLSSTLAKAGFREIEVMDYSTSSISGWDAIDLDRRENGEEYISDSLYVEARK